jgi:uncharacterized protein (TIGR03089 family)
MDPTAPTSVPLLMDRLRRSTRPALLWYAEDGERVELSGRVLDNWSAKTANLWVDELGLEAGDVVALGDEAHWRSLALVLGTWTMGAAVRLVDPGAPAGGDPAVAGLVRPDGELPAVLERVPDGARAVVVDRPALSMGYRGPLPGGEAVDYCAEIRAHADVYAGLEEPDPGTAALLDATSPGALQHGGLTAAAAELAAARPDPWGEAAAVHVPGRRMDGPFLLRVLAVLSAGRAAVLTDRDTAGEDWASVLAAENAVAW